MDTPPVPGADNYRIGREIATGGMGSIMEADDVKLGRTVAIKVMLLDAGADAAMRRRFIREAEILALLAHPNIVPVYDIIWEDGQPLFYSMKLVKGRTLQDILHALRKKELAALAEYPLERLLLIFRKVCDAVAFAHSHGVLHRDLKPENIMVGEFGEVLVMDWGIAKRMAEVSEPGGETAGEALRGIPAAPSSLFAPTLQGSVLGTPHYMSPEQAQGLIDDLDERSDIFALGGILYAILTLRPPVEGGTAAELLDKVRRGAITPPTQDSVAAPGTPRKLPHLPGGRVPPALAAVAMNALRLEKDRRYARVSALSADIESWQNGFATRAEEAGTLKKARLLVRRHRVVASSLGALLLISVAFMIKVMASEKRARESAAASEMSLAESRRSLARSQISVAEAAFRRADLPGMIGALQATPPDLREQSWRYLAAKRDASLGILTVNGFEDPVDLAALPGKAGLFALAARDGRIAIVEAAGGQVRRIIETGGRGNVRIAISGDGNRLLSRTEGAATARLFNLQTCQELAALPLLPEDAALLLRKGTPVPWGTLALDGTGGLAALASFSRERFSVVETGTGTVRWEGPGSEVRMLFHPDGSRLFVIDFLHRALNIYEGSTGALVASLPNYPKSMGLSPDGKFLAVGLYTGELVILDAMSGQELRRGQLHTNAITIVAWTAGGNLLTQGGEGRFESARLALRLWDPRRLSPLGTFFGIKHPHPYLLSSLNAASGHLLTCQGPPQLWQIHDQPLSLNRQSSEQGWSCRFLTDRDLLVREGFDLRRYDVGDPRRPVAVSPPFEKWHVLSAADPASGLFAVAKPIPTGPTSTVVLRRIAGGKISDQWARPMPAAFLDMDFDAAMQRLVLVRHPTGLTVLDVGTGHTLAEWNHGVDRAVFAGTRGNIAALERPRTNDDPRDRLLLIAAADGQLLASVGSEGRLNTMAVSPDRRLIAVAGDDQKIVLYDADTLKELRRFRAHDAAITALCFHPTLPRLVSGSIDFTLKVWDYETESVRHTIYGLGGRPISLSISPDGRLLAVDGMEYAFRIYHLPREGNEVPEKK